MSDGFFEAEINKLYFLRKAFIISIIKEHSRPFIRQVIAGMNISHWKIASNEES